MDLKKVLKIVENLETFRFENVYTIEQIEKDRDTLKDLAKQCNIHVVSTRFSPAIAEMKEAIIDDLKKLSKGYGKLKWAISKDTEIPVDILTVLLKQLKHEGKIELIMIWSESTGRPDGSGYCLTGKLSH